MTTRLYSFDSLKPHFYTVKLGFTGVYIIFLFLLKIIDCGYSLELPQWGSSNKYPQPMFWAKIWKISEFLSKNFHFLVVKISIYLNRHVLVMSWCLFPLILMLSTLCPIFSRWHLEIFSVLTQKTEFGIPCKFSPMETICMNCQILFFWGENETRGPWWPCNAHLSNIALWEPDLELIKANILIKVQNDYINK